MKSSRAMLLAAILFVAPVLADETTNTIASTAQTAPETTQTTEQKVEEKATAVAETVKNEAVKAESWTAAKFAVLTAAAAKVANWPVDNLTTPVLSRIPYLKNNAAFQNNVPTIGKAMLTVALVYGAIKAYEAYQAQNVDANDDEEIFAE